MELVATGYRIEKDQSRVSSGFVCGKRGENGQRDLVRAEHFLR